MEEEYDIIVLGTGLSECVLSGLASVQGKRVLHMDRNDYYGAESASINPLDRLYDVLGSAEQKAKTDRSMYGKGRDYNVDLVPKMLISNGRLLDLLSCTTVDRYIDFRAAGVAFTYTGGKIYKVPMTVAETLTTRLMWPFEKKRFKNFLEFLQNYEDHAGGDQFKHGKIVVSLSTTTMQEVYKKFNLAADTEDFIGHSMALYQEDSYKQDPCGKTFDKILLYLKSILRFGDIPDNKRSPYIYPAYGLGELPQGFARLSAVHGGTYMLNKPIDKIEYDSDGKFVGVTSEGVTARAKLCFGDPSYFTEKVTKVGQVIRAICILSHTIKGTDNRQNVVIVMPANQLSNKNKDIYITCLGPELAVTPEGKYLVTISTTVETDSPRQELSQALKLIGAVDEIFYSVKDLYTPTDDGRNTNTFISKSYDAASHFETCVDDIGDIYERAFNEPLDVDKIKADTKRRAEEAEAKLNEEMAATATSAAPAGTEE